MTEKVSVAIIAFNEATRIRPCLESVKWADEIVVVDSLSNDETVKICMEYTQEVISQPWLGYGPQKNFALSKVRNDWVLSVDADERVTSELRKEIENVLSKDSNCIGYYVPRKSFFLGKWIRFCGWYPDYNLRLFRKDRGRFKDRMVHECVEVQGPVGYLNGPLEHETYRSMDEYFDRMHRYSSLGAMEMKKEKKSTTVLDLLFRPPATFLKMYLVQQGFREGWRGFLLSCLYGMYTFSKYAKYWEMKKNTALKNKNYNR
jgi:glycosyltransferase involved in cell wall biosynthesis